MEDRRAPCVAIVGPAGSGKTTLLHLLDDALQLHAERPLAYVVKGNPDGTGRYLFHAPRLRDALKPRVKGAWSAVTVSTIAEWIERCRSRLELVLVDLGGRHAPANEELLGRCSHFVVVAKRFEDGAVEEREGMESWIAVGRRAGLELVARVRSMWGEGEPAARSVEDGSLDAAFRADACAPEDGTNAPVVAAMMRRLLALRAARAPTAYLDLRLPRDWRVDDLASLGGLAERLEELAGQERALLGGRAPIWAYAAALHRLLDLRPAMSIEVFDPKTSSGVVPIPETLEGEPGETAAESLTVRWEAVSGQGGAAQLALEITTGDRFLPPGFERLLPRLPLPEGPPPSGPVVVSGAGPIWLHLAYSRWLRSLPGERNLGLWDARTESAIFVRGPGAPTQVPWAVA